MDTLAITGGRNLSGSIRVSGSKNAALPIIAATLLVPGPCALENVPNISDITNLCEIIRQMDVSWKHADDGLLVNARKMKEQPVCPKLGRALRGSVLLLGPLLARFNRARIPLPGGCSIGSRAIDQHLEGLTKMGARFHWDGLYLEATAPEGLHGSKIHLKMPTVTGTANLMLAASLITDEVIICNAAREPELVDLATVLTKIGVMVRGAGTRTITIRGTMKPRSFSHSIMPDRIECGTFLIAGAMTEGSLTVTGGVIGHLDALIEILKELGISVIADKEGGIHVIRGSPIGTAHVTTGPYPAMPTDLQAPLMALLTTIAGIHTIVETIFENRFQHVEQLNHLGARIKIDGSKACIDGGAALHGTLVDATDLRAAAALALAALVAAGKTIMTSAQYIDRGYEDFVTKMSNVNAQMTRCQNLDECFF